MFGHIRIHFSTKEGESSVRTYERSNIGLCSSLIICALNISQCNVKRPCHHIPGGKVRPSVVEITDQQHPRIERAFLKYFYRADMPDIPTLPDDEENGRDDNRAPKQSMTENDISQKIEWDPQHEFEIIVCHANVIRYFFCRALQLPPEAWLRLCTFNCSLTYFTIRPTGTVSCRMLGDIGHLPYELNTFSGHTGFNW